MPVSAPDGTLAGLLGEWDAVAADIDVSPDRRTVAVPTASFDPPHFALLLTGEVRRLEDLAALSGWRGLVEDELRRAGHPGVSVRVKGRALIIAGADRRREVPAVARTVLGALAGDLSAGRPHAATPPIDSAGARADSALLSRLYGPGEPVQGLLRLAPPSLPPSGTRLSASSLTLVYVGGPAPDVDGPAPDVDGPASAPPPARPGPARSPADAERARPQQGTVRIPVPSSRRSTPLLLGARLPGDLTPEAEAALRVLVTLLGGNACSRLWRGLRDGLGLVYAPYASLHRTPAGAHWRIALDAEFTAVPQVLAAARQQIGLLRRVRPAAGDVDAARGFLVGSLLVRANGNERLCAMLAHWLAEGGGIPGLIERPHAVAGVGPEAVRAAAERLMDPEHTCTVLGIPDDVRKTT